MIHTISVQVENKPGVLSRVAGLFSARGYNIDSLTVSHTNQEDISIMTIVVRDNERIIEQIKKQLNKLVDVIKVFDHTNASSVVRELMLVRVNAKPSQRAELATLGKIYKADVSEVSQKTITFSIKAEPEKLDDFMELLRPYGITELMRTGRISMLREGENGSY